MRRLSGRVVVSRSCFDFSCADLRYLSKQTNVRFMFFFSPLAYTYSASVARTRVHTPRIGAPKIFPRNDVFCFCFSSPAFDVRVRVERERERGGGVGEGGRGRRSIFSEQQTRAMFADRAVSFEIDARAIAFSYRRDRRSLLRCRPAYVSAYVSASFAYLERIATSRLSVDGTGTGKTTTTTTII